MYKKDIRETALGLLKLGYTATDTVTELAKLFPKSAPDRRTVANWQRDFEKTNPDSFLDEEVYIARRVDAITHSTLDAIEDGKIKVSPVQALTMYGIAHDKVHRSRQLQRQESFLRVYQSDVQDTLKLMAEHGKTPDGPFKRLKAPIIEAEVRELD